MRGLWYACLLGVLLVTAGFPTAVYAGVFSGIVEKVSAEDRTITVKIARKEKLQTLDVRASATITVDNKPVTLDDLEIGQTVSVTTNGIDEVTKLSVRTGEAKTPDPKSGKKPVKKPAKKTGAKKPLMDENGEFIPMDAPPMEDDPSFPKGSAKPKVPKKIPGGKKKAFDDDFGNDQASLDKSSAGKPDREEHETAVVAGDWPQFRGPNRDNVSLETGLLAKWPDDGPTLAWKQTNIGLGYSSVAVANGKVFTMGNRGDDEYLLALDEATGEHLWGLRMGKAYHNGTGDGPRGTPTVDDDRVYALGGNGELVCVGAEKGDIVWQVNILEEFDGRNITWGISESVLIDGDHVICTPGGRKATMAAIDKFTGKTNWRSMVKGQPQAAYSSPIAIEVDGIRQYVNFVHTAVVGVNASDGRFLWSEQKSANGTANCSSPLFADDAVFSASGYGTGGALVKLTGSKAGVKASFAYHTPNMKNHHGGMAVVDGFVYGFDEGVLVCLEMKSGDVKWQDRSVGKGSLTVADGKLYLRSENGPVALAEVSSEGYQELGRFNQPDRSDKPSWSHPAVANGRLYLRDMDTLLVYNVKD